MKTINTLAAQGEVLILIGKANGGEDKLPTDAVKLEPEAGRHVFGHSETGHHHTVDGKRGTFYRDARDTNQFYFVPADAAPVQLEHNRPDHQHEAVSIESNGMLITVRRQISGWTRQAMID